VLDGIVNGTRNWFKSERINFDCASACRTLAEMSNGKSGRDLKNWIARAEQKAVQRAVVKGGAKYDALNSEETSRNFPWPARGQPTPD
jgi:SpoVK/Ycf46/Vps4 family AAA+-type ATPase